MDNNNPINQTKKCKQELCSYATTGICMEDKSEACPFLVETYLNVTVEPIQGGQPESPKAEDKIIRIRNGDDLNEQEVSLITHKFHTHLILLIGEPDCGKSTLFASIFDRFQKGGLGNYLFCETQTPLGFERRAHHARLISQNRVSKAERTSSEQFTYLHLGVKIKDSNSRSKHILFADVTGEKYKDARASDSVMRSLNIIRRASKIFLIADGDLLLIPGSKHDVRRSLVQTISRAIQNEMFFEGQKLHLIITKWDKINAAGNEEDIQTFLVEFLQQKFDKLIGSIFKIASRSTNLKFPAGTGLDKFLDECLSDSDIHLSPTGSKPEQEYRYFDRFLKMNK